MRLSLLALAVFAHEGHDEEEENQDFGDVVQLTDANFKEFIQENPLTLVKFYAPWCGHCKQMKPAYIEAASLLLKEKIPIAELDCIAQAETCKVYNVQGFPSLKIFRNGTESEYKGQRSAESIVSTMKKQLLPAITPLPNVEKAEAFLSAHKVAVVGFFDASNKKEQDGFKTIAEQVFRDDFTFASSNDVKVLKHYGVKAPAVVLFKDFDEKKSVYSGDYSKKSLSDFVMTYSMRIMGEITPENYEMYAKRGLPIGFFFYGSEEHKTKYGPILEKFAKKYRKTVSFVYLDASAHGGHADNLALKQTWPAFGIQDEAKRTKYPFDQSLELNEANFGEWITSYADGTLAPAIKSEEIPESNDGPVKVLVGKQFNDIVLDKSKDVFIKFYARNCV
jgi:protein disulfide-isomerase A1